MTSLTGQSLVILLLTFYSVEAQKERSERTSCYSDEECQQISGWQSPYQICDLITNKCKCPDGECEHVTLSSMVWWESNRFCGICKDVGSTCNSNYDCPTVSECNVFCICKAPAANKNDMCRIDKVIPRISLTTVWLLLGLCTSIFINKFIGSKKFRNRLRFWRNRGRRGQSSDPAVAANEAHRNPNSNSKTAAYTISNTDFISTSVDPDLDWAIEFSLMELNRQPRRSREEITEEPTSISEQNVSSNIDIERSPGDTVTQFLTENTFQTTSQVFEPILEQINVAELVNSAVAESSNITLSQQENAPACSAENSTIEDKDQLAYDNPSFEDDTLSNLNDGQFPRASSNSQSSNRKRTVRLVPRQSYRRSGSPPQYVNHPLQNQSDVRM